MADPGFPRGGGANPKGANFSQKLHENEEISGQMGGGGARPSHLNLDPPLFRLRMGNFASINGIDHILESRLSTNDLLCITGMERFH